jgi:cell division protease FtsH
LLSIDREDLNMSETTLQQRSAMNMVPEKLMIGMVSPPAVVRHDVERHLGWICQVTGVEAQDLVMLDVSVDFSRSFFNLLMDRESDHMGLQGWRSGLSREVIQSFETEPSTIPSVHLTWVQGAMYSRAGQGSWRSTWNDCPVAVRLQGLTRPVIVLRTPNSSMDSCPGWSETAVLSKEDVPAFMKLMEAASSSQRESVIHFQGAGFITRRAGSWDEVVMGPEGETLLRNDFESFWERRAWFQRQRLPYRRGYLLHGPAGNGKSSAIRAMLSRKGLSAHSIHLHLPDISDSDLLKMFEAAGDAAPAVIVLEDIDKGFAPRAEMDDSAPHVHLQTLLNCLDGIATCDGVVVVATANNPEVLDTAILRRPGRFDRVVEFPNPAADLRQKYLARKLCTLAIDDMQACVDRTDGFSFAQLQESYILAGQLAYDENRDVTGSDLIRAAEMLKDSMHKVGKRTERRGFKVADPR